MFLRKEELFQTDVGTQLIFSDNFWFKETFPLVSGYNFTQAILL
jgi:hypothetical protein